MILGLNFAAQAQSTSFTYQGYLTKDGTPYTGNAEFMPTLWDAVSDGNLVAGNTPSGATLGVTNGLFLLPLNFGFHFPGADRWLQIEVRTPAGSGVFTTLTPRQPITSAPYAITAGNLSGILPVAQLSGQLTGPQIANGTIGSAKVDSTEVQLRVIGSAPAGQFITGILANGSVSAAADNTDWKLGGNAGTSPGANFLGTTDGQPVEFRAGNQRALRLEAGGTESPNVIGGSSRNTVSGGVAGATIAGGGSSLTFGGTIYYPNAIGGNLGAIGGGAANTIGTNSSATIGGGFGNTARARESTIGGGGGNWISDTASYATISGGASNTNSGQYASVAGGQFNVASGDFSFAAGDRAKAVHGGAFVWADSGNADFSSTATNQFLVRASGGVGINTNNPAGAALSVVGGIRTGAGGTIQTRVQFGTATVGTGLAGVNTFTITFPAAFGSAPKVFVMTKGNDNPDTFAISTRAVTASNFKVNIVRIDTAGGWGQALQVDWYAVE